VKGAALIYIKNLPCKLITLVLARQFCLGGWPVAVNCCMSSQSELTIYEDEEKLEVSV
jgi:hypothetical protein